jgi:hypothetical protein
VSVVAVLYLLRSGCASGLSGFIHHDWLKLNNDKRINPPVIFPVPLFSLCNLQTALTEHGVIEDRFIALRPGGDESEWRA